MLQRRRDFILEFLAVDRLAASSGAGRVAGLDHEVGDYAVEDYAVVVTPARKGFEVFAGLEGLVGFFG